MDDKITFIFIGCLFFIFIGCAVVFGNNYNLDRIKSKTVGDGQHGTASFATQREINNTFKKIDFNANKWRNRINLPKHQGLVVGTQIKFNKTTCYIDTDDIHLLMIGAAKAISYSPVIVLGQTYLAKSIGFASGITLGVSQTIGGIIAPVVGNLADTYSLSLAMMTLVPFLIVGLGASLLLKDPKKLQ